MLSRRFDRLFDRYCAQNLVVMLPGRPLQSGGHVVGEVAYIARLGNRLEVAGQICADVQQVSLRCGEDLVTTVPRPAHAGEEPRHFTLNLPVGEGALELQLIGLDGPPFALPQVSNRAYLAARRRLMPRFLARLIRAMPLILQWALRRDPALRPRIRNALGFWVLPEARGLADDIFDAPVPQAVGEFPEITCIMPVYNAFELLPEALERVWNHTDIPWHLILIEDASPDPAVRPFLQGWAKDRNAERTGCVTLLENPRNIGFIGSVNRGLAAAAGRGGPVILLNSDAFVPKGWASRLVRPLLTDASVASVTPMSNDAEIFSVPVICVRSDLAPGQGDEIDKVAAGFVAGAGDAAAPTGVGFCMALSAEWLAKVPQFDTAFGRGYGEEVDWCQKVSALGGRHLGVANLFVEHRGGSSFGSEEKRRLIAASADIISHRYREYDISVQDYLRNDPMGTPRLALAIASLAGADEVPIYLAHAMGGGVDQYHRQRFSCDIAAQGGLVVLRVGTDLRWRLEVHTSAGVSMGATDDFALVEKLLAPLKKRRIVYSCGVGDSDPVSLPARLIELADGPDLVSSQVEVLFHDFYPLSPSCNLLSQEGTFQGVPRVETADTAQQVTGSNGTIIDLAQWRSAWGRLIARADRLVAFSNDSKNHVLEVWPDAAPRLHVVPHRMPHDVPRITPRKGAKPVVGILGNLNYAKGNALVGAMGKNLEAGGQDLGLVLIGDTDPACPPLTGVKVHGAYRIEDLELLTRRHRITAWFVASICPETFSYTTHEALATGLPVFCLDLGAQAEALRAANAKGVTQGYVIAHHTDLEQQAQAVLDELRTVLLAG